MRRQFANMGDVFVAHGAKLRGQHRRYGDGVTWMSCPTWHTFQTMEGRGSRSRGCAGDSKTPSFSLTAS